MARIFSWKIATGKYAYLTKEGNSMGLPSPYIGPRITDPYDLNEIARGVDDMSWNQYLENFTELANQVTASYPGAFGDDIEAAAELFFGGGSTAANVGERVILISGIDGYDGRAAGVDNTEDGFLGETDWYKLEKAIEAEMNKHRAELSALTEEIKRVTEEAAARNLVEALNRLSAATQELADIKEGLTSAATQAQQALDAARALSGLTEEEITPELLHDIVSKIGAVQAWEQANSGKIQTLLTAYDNLTQDVGSIATAQDVARGYLSYMNSNINAISGTVGTVRVDLDASRGKIAEIGTWYDENAESMTEAARILDASKAAIEDYVNFYNGDMTSSVGQYMNAMSGTIKQQAMVEISGVATSVITREVDAINGRLQDTIDYVNDLSGGIITTMGQRWNAVEGTMEQVLIRSNSAITETRQIREEWNIESGILRTVSDMVIQEDSHGNAKFQYVDISGNTRQVVKITNPSYAENHPEYQKDHYYFVDDDWTTYQEEVPSDYMSNVFPKYMTNAMTYIRQSIDSLEFLASSGDVIAALRLQTSPDGSSIYMTADRVLIDSDVIANSITSKAANIGGVHIGNGMISAKTGSNKWALRGDGILEATGAKISGGISATSLYLGTDATNTLNTWVNGKGYTTTGDVANQITGAADTYGWVVEEDLDDYLKLGFNYNNSHSSITISKQGLLVAKNAIISGTVFANQGIFNGDVYANNGTFNGSITATSLQLGTAATNTLNTWVNGKGYATTGDVNSTKTALQNQIASAKTDAMNKIFAVCGRTEAAIALANAVSASSTSLAAQTAQTANGGIRHTININGVPYHWDTYDAGDYMLLDTKVGTGTTGGPSNGTMVLIDKNGLLTANNAVVYGNIYASNGYFKGAVSATQGTFTGEIHATSLSVGNKSITEFVNDLIPEDGVTTGTVQNMINNSSGWIVTQAQNGVVKINTKYGGATSSFTLSNTGLLVANNAVISGTVFATHGIFNGDIYARNGVFQGTVSAATIYASDIVLDGNALKLFSSANTFEISDAEIEVQEVPEDVTIKQASYNYSSFDNTTSGGCAALFTAMGDNTTIIPPHYIQATGSKALDYHQSIVGTAELVCAVFSADSHNTYAYGFLSQQNMPYPDLSRAISSGSNIANFSMTSDETYKDVSINASFDEAGGTSAELHLPCRDGVDYVVVFAWIQNGFQTQYLQQFTINFPKYSFVNAPNPTDTQFFNIGSNGMQIFLGNGFYFTAARDRTQGPIIAMGGQNMQGQMFGLRLTRTNGIQILTGQPGTGWHTPE